jgi:hypothetical protein
VRRLLIALTLACSACSVANMSAISAWGQPHCVRFYGCDGKEIARWTSTGKIENESHSNGFYFKDAKTGLIVMVDGNFTATVGECGEVGPHD